MSTNIFPSVPTGRTYAGRTRRTAAKAKDPFPTSFHSNVFTDSPVAKQKTTKKDGSNDLSKKNHLCSSTKIAIKNTQSAAGAKRKKQNAKKNYLKNVNNVAVEKSHKLFYSNDSTGSFDGDEPEDHRDLHFGLVNQGTSISDDQTKTRDDRGDRSALESVGNVGQIANEASQDKISSAQLHVTGSGAAKDSACVVADVVGDLDENDDIYVEDALERSDLLDEDSILTGPSDISTTMFTGLETDSHTGDPAAYTYVWTSTSSDQCSQHGQEVEDSDSVPSIEIMRDAQDSDSFIMPNPTEVHKLSFRGSKVLDDLFTKKTDNRSRTCVEENTRSISLFSEEPQRRFNSTLIPSKQARPIHAVALPENMSSISLGSSAEKFGSFGAAKSSWRTGKENKTVSVNSLQNTLEKTPASFNSVPFVGAPVKTGKFGITKRTAAKPGCSTLLFQTQIAPDDFFPELSNIASRSSEKENLRTGGNETEIEMLRCTQRQTMMRASTPFQFINQKENAAHKPNHSKNLFHNDISSVPPASFGDSELAVDPPSILVNSDEIVVAELTVPVPDVELPEVEVISCERTSDLALSMEAAPTRKRESRWKKPAEKNIETASGKRNPPNPSMTAPMSNAKKKGNQCTTTKTRVANVHKKLSKQKNANICRHSVKGPSPSSVPLCIMATSDQPNTSAKKSQILMSIEPLGASFLKREREAPLDILCMDFSSKNPRISTRCPNVPAQISH